MNNEIKSMDGWGKSGVSIDKYLKIGDVVESGMVDYFMNCLPPRVMWSSLLQMGEPYSSVADENGDLHMTYLTFSKNENNEWIYTGYCFAGETMNRVKKLVA